MVAEAKKQATAETVEERKNGLAKLFDSQMETLKSRGCPQAILEAFQNQRDAVLSKAAEMEIYEGHIPFVPVIPRIYMGVYGLMPMVRNGEKVGYTYLDPNEITDQVETPKNPYFIYDVEDGKDMLGKSPEKSEKIITEQKRSCLTADEGIAVCTHTNVLSEHYVDCAGSHYRRADGVPRVSICLTTGRCSTGTSSITRMACEVLPRAVVGLRDLELWTFWSLDPCFRRRRSTQIFAQNVHLKGRSEMIHPCLFYHSPAQNFLLIIIRMCRICNAASNPIKYHALPWSNRPLRFSKNNLIYSATFNF